MIEAGASESGGWAGARTESLSPAPGTRRDSLEHLEPGTVLAQKFRIVGRLGSGGMGVVYEALDLRLRRHVALKLPLAGKLSAALSARLFREARVAAALTPDHTARVFEVGALEDGTPFLVLEKLEGENLSERLRRMGPLGVTHAVDLVAEACVGLQEAHRRGVIHRDLKPSNLFVVEDPDGTRSVRVLDFGIASVLEREPDLATDLTLTDTGSTLGSPPYMAPEQLRAARDVDARADVWALGVTLHQVLTTKLPFAGSGAALVAAIVADPPRKPHDEGVIVPGGLEQLIARCLSKDPSRRPRDGAALGRELLAFASPEKRRALAAAFPGSAKERRWWLAGPVILAAGLVALGAGASAFDVPAEPAPSAEPATNAATEANEANPSAPPLAEASSIPPAERATPSASGAISAAATPSVVDAAPRSRASRTRPRPSSASPSVAPGASAPHTSSLPLLDAREF